MRNILSPQLFAILGTLVEGRVGLHYGPEDADVFADKVAARMNDAGFESPLDYYYFLRYDDPSGTELDALVDALVVGETYLFRELGPLTAAIEHVVAPAVSARGRARVWSAGCASGEEPATIAMLLADAGLLPRVEIVGTDVSQRAVARAKAGVYPARSLRVLGPGADPTVARVAGKYLVREETGNVARLVPALREVVTYRQVNLVDRAAVAALGQFDLVLCRNVLIYFRDETVQQVVAHLGAALAPEGRVLVGASESLLRFGTQLRCEERGGSFFYTKEGT